MRIRRATLLPCLLVTCVLFPSHLFAPIYGSFPGIETLVQKADTIVIATIRRRPHFFPPMAYGEYEVMIERTVKGEMAEGSSQLLALRELAYGGPGPWDLFSYGTRHLIFLERKSDPQLTANYWMLNYEGAHLEVSPYQTAPAVSTFSISDIQTQVRGYGQHGAIVFDRVWLVAGIAGTICSLLLKILLGTKQPFQRLLWIFVFSGFCLGVMTFAVGLTFYARDVSVLTSGWLFVGRSAIVALVAAAIVGPIVWIVSRKRSRHNENRPTT